MPRIIVKCRYIKSAPTHRFNLVEYMATREGVDKEISADHPASKKQEAMIARLLRSAPDAKDSFEYEDYIANPTAKSASEFITQALEQNADRFTDRKIFLEYIANRPRVQRLGAHGLFSDTDAPINLAEVQREVAEHPGNVWTNVVSLRREDASRLGFDNASAWRALMRERRNDIATQMKIAPENFRWYAAYHDERSHPHIHVIAYSTDPREAYLSKQGIDSIRSCLAREIFQQDLVQIYSEQTVQRDALSRESLSVMREMCEKMQNGICDNPRIESLMQTLNHRLSKTGGKKQYGYLKTDIKAIVDSVVDELAKDERVGACYAAWYEIRNQVLQTYADKLPDPLPISQQKEFKSIKNMVIAEAMRIGSFDIQITRDFATDTEMHTPNSEAELFNAPEDDPDYSVEWSEQYKQARDFLFGTKEQPPDFDAAHTLLMMEAENGNALAMHDLGRMYADGLGREISAEDAHGWYAKALAGFVEVEGTTHKPYIQYRIGKMYAAGLGTDQNYEQAARWFTSAAVEDHKYAQYSLGGLYYRGQGVAQNYEKAFALYQASATQENAYADYELAKMLRDGVGCAKNSEQANEHFEIAFTGFQSMKAEGSDDKLQYRLGQMHCDGVGTDVDMAQARLYFEASSKLGNSHAQYALAKLIIETGDTEKIAEAVAWLEKSANGGNPFAGYSLGKLYLDGTDIKKDVQAAIRWLTASAEQENEYAQYAIGRLFLSGEDVPKDTPAAIHWLTASAEQENQFAQYQLGKLYLLGKDVPLNREQAVHWFELSAAQGNEYAQFFLDHMNAYPNPSLLFSATNLIRGLSKLFEDQQQKLTAQANHIDRKRAQQLRQKLQAQGHAQDEHIQNY